MLLCICGRTDVDTNRRAFDCRSIEDKKSEDDQEGGEEQGQMQE